MASSALSPVLRAQSSDGGNSSATPSPDSYDFPVPPEWIIADPEENKRRILAMLEQGDHDIAANIGSDVEEVFREADESIAAAMTAEADRRHVLALLEQGESDIAAGCTTDGAEVQRRMRARIAARRSSATPR